MKLRVSHTTHYQYDVPVTYALLRLRLTPKETAGQRIEAWSVDIEGGSEHVQFTDQHNNHVSLVGLDPERTEIEIRCDGEVETTNGTGVIGKHGGYAPLWYFLRNTDLTQAGEGVRALIETDAGPHDVMALHALSARIAERVTYTPGTTDSKTTADQALAAGSGVCQDHAHIFIAAARQMGIPARYVGGYLMMNDRIDQEAGHAWAEAHLPGLGWVGFDVSNGISPDERYIRVATGLDYRDAAPISGVRLGDSSETMSVALQVQQ